MKNNKEINATFKILMALAMIMVVAGHVNCPALDIYGLFPYYSFHMPLFIFVSGYFFKEEDTGHIPAFLRRKAMHLLVPYFVWNVLYGLMVMALQNKGFQFGESFSLTNLFVQPFTDGHQFLYNSPAWFVPALFLVQTSNVLIRRGLKLLHLEQEAVLLAGYMAVGVISVLWAGPAGLTGIRLTVGRICFLLPFFEWGHFYRIRLERYDRLASGWYFLIVVGIQLGLLYVSKGSLPFSAAFMQFPAGPVTAYLASATGIAFWMRVAWLLTPALKKSRFIRYLADHTYAVMLHQRAGFLALGLVFYGISVTTGWCDSFSLWQLQTDFEYLYLPGNRDQFRLLYVLAGIYVPFLIQHAQDFVLEKGREWLIGRSTASAPSCKAEAAVQKK